MEVGYEVSLTPLANHTAPLVSCFQPQNVVSCPCVALHVLCCSRGNVAAGNAYNAWICVYSTFLFDIRHVRACPFNRREPENMHHLTPNLLINNDSLNPGVLMKRVDAEFL